MKCNCNPKQACEICAKSKGINWTLIDSNHCAFKKGDNVIAFNYRDWSKTGDLPEGNNKYWQEAKILKLRFTDEWLADLKFENGLISNGHFVRGIELINA